MTAYLLVWSLSLRYGLGVGPVPQSMYSMTYPQCVEFRHSRVITGVEPFYRHLVPRCVAVSRDI